MPGSAQGSINHVPDQAEMSPSEQQGKPDWKPDPPIVAIPYCCADVTHTSAVVITIAINGAGHWLRNVLIAIKIANVRMEIPKVNK